MCGIAGYVMYSSNNKDNYVSILDDFSHSLAHRGPDDIGFLTYSQEHGLARAKNSKSIRKGNVGLVHRRLSILDLNESGWQPMLSANGRFAIIHNGEVYNYVEIRKELEKHGYNFTSTTDTEVVIHAYQQWGKECLNRFIGMFAFVILDLREHILFCARDFFGIKPFYYTSNRDGFVFASETKALLKTGFSNRKANLQLAYDYLVSSMQEGTKNSFFDDIKQLPPAHYMEISLNEYHEPRPVRYWSVTKERSKIGLKEATNELTNLFANSVKIHLRSDVPVAANLSGGIDSSSIVMMSKQITGGDLNLQTISYIADDESVSEEKWIDIINMASGSTSRKVKPTSADLTKELEQLILAQDEPVGSSSAFAQFRVFRAIQQLGLKVVLDGQGADELLGGYRSYLIARLASLLKQYKFISALIFGFNATRLPGAGNLLKTYAASKALAQFSRLIRKTERVLITNAPEWINWKWFCDREITASPSWFSTDKEIMREQLLYTFQESNLPHLLRVADRNSMAFSVESRLPFLTPQLVNFIFSLPERFIIDNKATTKAIFRKSMRDVVPNEILSRKDKIGFTTPEHKWLLENSKWVEGILNSETAHNIPFMNPAMMQKEWQALKNGNTYFCWRFWRWINYIKWAESYNVNFG